jgi:Phosphodiester glycosidase
MVVMGRSLGDCGERGYRRHCAAATVPSDLHPVTVQLSRLARHAAVAALSLLAAACRRTPAPLPAPALAADSVRARTLAPGVVHRTYFIGAGPWVVQVLDADRARCWTAVPLKAAPLGPARELLSTMVARARPTSASRLVVGAVNADFFLFAPDGLPTGAQVSAGDVLFGPGEREVFAVDSAMRPHVARFAVDGWLVRGGDSVRITRWNRPDSTRVAIFDPAYGPRIDSARLGVAVPLRLVGSPTVEESRFGTWGRLDSGREAIYVADRVALLGPEAPAIDAPGAIVLAGRGTSESVRAILTRIAGSGDTVRVRVALRPFHPLYAVGGNGVLLRRGAVPARLDSVGNAGFRGRNPRTAVGFDSTGRRLLLVAIDGRQPGYSVGTSLRETAEIMRQLGADEALNLDGGGSTTFVVPDVQTAQGVTIANRPSDKTERKVANGLAVARVCPR